MSILAKVRNRLYKLRHPEWGRVVMLHRVVEQRSQLSANKELEITPDFLEETILYYKKKRYEFVSLDEMHSIVTTGQPRKKFICFTFDDGYIDNYEIAYPIFKKYNCPFSIFIATDFLNGKAHLWWYVLEKVLNNNTEVRLSDGSYYDCSTALLKDKAFYEIRDKIKQLPTLTLEKEFNSLFAKYDYSFSELIALFSMTWWQIEILSGEELCTIASHTVSHGVLSTMSDVEIRTEVHQSKLLLERFTQKDIQHFAYPYGAYNDRVIPILKEIGYKTALLANGGVIREKQNEFKINRYHLRQK